MEHTFVDEYDVLTWQLQALFTYWCHVDWLRFCQDILVVYGRQMVSLVSVHGRGSLFDIYIYIYIYSLLHSSLVTVRFTGQYVSVLHGHLVFCGPTMICYSCWFIQVCVFFESLVEWSLGSTNVCVAAVDVIC